MGTQVTMHTGTLDAHQHTQIEAGPFGICKRLKMETTFGLVSGIRPNECNATRWQTLTWRITVDAISIARNPAPDRLHRGDITRIEGLRL